MKRVIKGSEENEKGKQKDYLQTSISNSLSNIYKQLLTSSHENTYMIIKVKYNLLQTFVQRTSSGRLELCLTVNILKTLGKSFSLCM